MPARTEDLVNHVVRQLELEQMYVARFAIWDTKSIKALRDAGRRAGRQLGRTVRTFERPSGDGLEMVVIIFAVESTEDDAQVRARGNALLRQALEHEPPPQGS